ncbi:hypothetical protein SAMN02927916_1229 [Flavobacterium anhuiense]|uniref:Uncharacterized protein n=1 Tax=Flavobacterium anhuiense TaxID=459526 RepID=A0ABY0LG67_9FLAO|nr:hypothetical protein [Flavobacterium anhuiense]SCY13691.1 hypothetical protein SAMN02927916_1229 [Flavobacterium anhuiense]
MSIKTPKNRLEFEHNINFLEERGLKLLEVNNESAIQNYVWATLPHLRKVRKLPNGRINLLTINEQIRLQANMLNSDLFSK